MQLNISCPTREGYVIAKALVSKLLKQLVQEFHETTLGKEAAVMRGSDHPMNPELPENWAHQFMQGYYNQMVDQVLSPYKDGGFYYFSTSTYYSYFFIFYFVLPSARSKRSSFSLCYNVGNINFSILLGYAYGYANATA